MVNHRSSLAILFLVLLFSSKSFSQDSLVRIQDLKFSSNLEKKNFTKYFKDKDPGSLTSLLLATNSAMSEEKDSQIRREINALENSLTISGIQKRKPQRKIKEVYDFVHRAMLRKYELECSFDQIFVNGVYNCVTATALFALIFDDLKIPYQIKEKPTHVYLLAYPNVENIMVETTSPLFGYLTFDNDYKQKFITILKNQKIISSDEIGKKSTDELFNQYYFENENIDLAKLVGIHYMNDAIFKKDKDQIQEAYNQLEKSYLFYPSPRCQFLLMNYGVEVVVRIKLPPKEKSILIAKVSRYKDQGITVDMIKGEFYALSQDVLFRENNKRLYKECYELLLAGVHDKEMSDEISYIYFYENGRAFFNQENYTSAKPFFEKALKLQPNNVDLNKIFVTILSQAFRRMDDNKTLLDSITYYHDNFPVLTQYNSFNSSFAYAYLIQFQNEFASGHADLGNKYRLVFEEAWRLHKGMNISESEIGNAYSAAIEYYNRRQQKVTAKELLKKGLEISPNNYRLGFFRQTLGK